MKKLGVLVLFSCVLTVKSLDGVVFHNKCIEALGCFYTGPPFYHPIYRPISLTPSSHLDTKFLLYSRETSNNPMVLEPTEESLNTSTLDPHIDTYIVVHGYSVKLENDVRFIPTRRTKDELLKNNPCNVIIVNWTSSNQSPYPQAVANARAVAAQVANLINFHVKNRGLDPKSVHLIGHSLGAHLCGWVGERIPGLQRISGLDPAGPWFQHAENEVRLDTTDADFVDIIHTNGENNLIQGNGLYQPIGHLDFYPNGGQDQPGCSKRHKENTTQLKGDSCSHSKAHYYFMFSINTCQFIGVKCSNYKDFKNKKCTRENSLVAEMGFHCIKIPTPPNETSFFLDTSDKAPFCEDSDKL